MHVESIGNLQDARRLMRGYEAAVGVVSDPAWALHGQARRLVDGKRVVGGYVLAPAGMLEDSGLVPPGIIVCDRPSSELMAFWVADDVPRLGRLKLVAAIASDLRKRKSQLLFGVAMSEKSVPLMSSVLPDELYQGPGGDPDLLPWLHVRRGTTLSPLKLRLATLFEQVASRLRRQPKRIASPDGDPEG